MVEEFILKKNQFFSRIRVEDIARVLDKVLKTTRLKEKYLIFQMIFQLQMRRLRNISKIIKYK